MKPFDYYDSKVVHPNYNEMKREWIAFINNSPMTAAEREIALAGATKYVNEIHREQCKPYHEDQNRLDMEFMQDCRDTLGYMDTLTASAASRMEYEAYERGHSAGRAEVYCCLESLWDYTKTILACQKAVD